MLLQIEIIKPNNWITIADNFKEYNICSDDKFIWKEYTLENITSQEMLNEQVNKIEEDFINFFIIYKKTIIKYELNESLINFLTNYVKTRFDRFKFNTYYENIQYYKNVSISMYGTY